MQLPNEVNQKMGVETSIYTLLRRHQNTTKIYNDMLEEPKLAADIRPVLNELIANHEEYRAQAESLLRDFPGSPVKPNEQTLAGKDHFDTEYPVRFDEVSNVYPYLKEEEEQLLKLYSEIAKRGSFPDSVGEFLTKGEQASMEMVNKLDFLVKAR